MNIKINHSATTLRIDTIAAEMGEYGVVMSHVHYGPGWPISTEETIANVVLSFRMARAAFGQVWLVFDGEDTGFGSESSEMERIFDEPIENDTHALLAWWESYGYGSGEEAEPLRRMIGELAQVEYRSLTEAQ